MARRTRQPLGSPSGEPSGGHLLDSEVGSEDDAVAAEAPQDLTPEQASRLAVLAADLEYWARAVSTDGYIVLNDLTRTLDIIRDASAIEV